jgi:hypothetical protein
MPEATSGHGFIIWAIMWAAIAVCIAAVAASSQLASNTIAVIIVALMTWPFFVWPVVWIFSRPMLRLPFTLTAIALAWWLSRDCCAPLTF